jgi:hypothetical protein
MNVAGSGSVGGSLVTDITSGRRSAMKGFEKPKKLQKKQPQKTLKQRRSEKRAAPKKYGP